MSNIAQTPVSMSREVALQAAEWFLLLQSPTIDHLQREACNAWRQSAPEHEQAWQRAVQMSQRLGLIPASLGGPVLRRPLRMDRRRTIKTLAMLVSGIPVAWFTARNGTELASEWGADFRTAKGEQRRIRLADGTQLHLNTDTAVDVVFDAAQRLLVLRSGEIFIETAADAQARPFGVATEAGMVRAIGTRFNVRQRAGAVRVGVLEGAVEVSNEMGRERVDAGHQLDFSAQHIGALQAVSGHDSAWTDGLLVADNMRLDVFLQEIGRYRYGWLRCDSAVADLRVSGAFQLRETDPVLSSLGTVLPIEVVFRTRYWITVIPRLATT